MDLIAMNAAKLPFPCDRPSCGKKFARKAILLDHLNTHENKKPYVCPYTPCLIRFTRKSDMRRHYAKHTGSGDVVSPTCEHRFSRKDAYRKHECGAPRRQDEPRKDHFPCEAAAYESVQSVEEHQLCEEQWLPLLYSCPHDGHTESKSELLVYPDELNIPLSDPVDSYTMLQMSPLSISGKVKHEGPSAATSLPEISVPSVVAYTSSEEVQILGSRTKRATLRTTAPRSIPMASKTYGTHFECFLCGRKHVELEELRDHLVQHQLDSSSSCRYECKECKIRFHHHFELEAHRETVQLVRFGSGSCDCCGEDFAQAGVKSHKDLGRHSQGNE